MMSSQSMSGWWRLGSALVRAGAGLVLAAAASGAMAQNAANGRILYNTPVISGVFSCASCHFDPAVGNSNNIRAGANPAVIRNAINRGLGGMNLISLSDAELADIAAYLADPNARGANIVAEPTALRFQRGVNTAGRSRSQVIKVVNNGGASVAIAAVGFSGGNAGDYQLAAVPAGTTACTTLPTIAPNQFCTVAVNFDAGSIGARNSTLVITPEASSDLEPTNIVLNGTGTANAQPFSTVDILSVDFGGAVVASARTQTITVTNNGDANLVFDANDTFAFDGPQAADYSVVDGVAGACEPGGTLAEGATCKVDVRFTAGAGVRSATLTIGSNSNEDPVVNLRGTGIVAGDDEGGGCSIAKAGARFDPLLLLLAGLAAVVLVVRRRRRA